MKKRLMALALLAALTLSFTIPAFADETESESPRTTAQEAASSAEDTGEAAEGEAPEQADDAAKAEAPSLAGPDGADLTYTPDEVGFVSFANVESRMRAENLKILALQQSIETLQDIDYEKLEDDLRDAINEIADAKWAMLQMQAMEPIGAQLAIANMDTQREALKEQFDDIKEGKLQADNAGIVRQLQNAQNQIILAAESTFIALKAMDTQEGALQRQLASLNRTVEEMELRYEMGQISALQLAEVKAGRSSLISGLTTLQMNIDTYKAQLEQLLGAQITGAIALGEVPAVTAEQVAAMDLEADMAAYKAASYELYDAEQTLADAKEEFEDARDEYNANEKKQAYRAAKRTWEAAQYTYNDTVQSCELKFRAAYNQVKDYLQIYEASLVSLECEKSSFAASELKYSQGTISQNAFLTAQDDLRTAEETAENAMNDLFSSYNTYCWAVRCGILN